MRGRLREDRQNKASGVNLAVAAITLWNTVYLQKAVQILAEQGTPIPPECLPHLSPPGWEHINMTSDYVWAPRGHRAPESNRMVPGALLEDA